MKLAAFFVGLLADVLTQPWSLTVNPKVLLTPEPTRNLTETKH